MKQKRLDDVWNLAYRMYQDSARTVLHPVSTDETSERLALKASSEKLARACFWSAFYAMETLDKEFTGLRKRLAK